MRHSKETSPSNRETVVASQTEERAERRSLGQWVHRVIGLPHLRLQIRLRGNHLYILCEAAACPTPNTILPKMVRALVGINWAEWFSSDQPPIYQVVFYGRKLGTSRPAWSEVVLLNQLDPYLDRWSLPGGQGGATGEAHGEARSQRDIPSAEPSPPSALVMSNYSLARQGNREAIARYLGETLSTLGVAVRVSVKTKPVPDPTNSQTIQRLWIICESAYSPDPAFLAEPIARRLRELKLEGFRDGVVLSQVSGEPQPDWMLRVDLTPPDDMLRDWARWGDLPALTRLLNQQLAEESVQVSIFLKDMTLHLTCTALRPDMEAPDKEKTVSAIGSLLQSLAPQGIQAATVYGFRSFRGEGAYPMEAPLWVDWLELPARDHPALAVSPLTLAQQGDRPAIHFMLTRLLNPDLEAYLTTGGIRLQIMQKGELLHIMGDAPSCPDQRPMGPAIVRFLRPLALAGVKGVRIYGRRAGQKLPLWSYGVDFVPRQKTIPDAAPEFAASDAYVGELLNQSGALVLRPDLTSDDLHRRLRQWMQRIAQSLQQGLTRSRLFTLDDPTVPPLPQTSKPQPGTFPQGVKLAIVWGSLGLLLTLQTDWLLGWVVSSRSTPIPPVSVSPVPSPSIPSTPVAPVARPSVRPTPAADLNAFPKLSLRKSNGNQDAFNSSGFTSSRGSSLLVENPEAAGVESKAPLAASPLQPLVTPRPGSQELPPFNNRLLDEKLAMYREQLALSGSPDVLIVGSSRALRGIDPVALEQALAAQGFKNIDVFNLGINGATAQVVELVIRDLLPSNHLPRLIIWADGARAFNSGRVDVTYNAIATSKGYQQLAQGKPLATPQPSPAATPVGTSTVATSSGAIADSYQAASRWFDQVLARFSATYNQRSELKSLLRHQLSSLLPKDKAPVPPLSAMVQSAPGNDSPSEPSPSSLPSEGQGMIDINGFLPLSNQFNPATYYQTYARVSGDYDSDYESFRLEGRQLEALDNLVRFTRARQIPLVFVNLPLTADYLDPVRREYEFEFQQQLRSLAAAKQFVYLDLSQLWITENDYFSDPSHLNRYGAYAVSQQLAQAAMIPWEKARKPAPVQQSPASQATPQPE